MMEPVARLHVAREYNRLWDGHCKAKVGREEGDILYNNRREGESSIQNVLRGTPVKATFNSRAQLTFSKNS